LQPLDANSRRRGHSRSFGQTDHDATIVCFYLYLAAAFVTVRALIQRARHRYRWDTRPPTKRLYQQALRSGSPGVRFPPGYPT
jgi:hypothetical protein